MLTMCCSYDDFFLSLVPGDKQFIGDRSIVVHYANKTRITCGNLVLAGSNSTSTNATNNGTSYFGVSRTLRNPLTPSLIGSVTMSHSMPSRTASSSTSLTETPSSTSSETVASPTNGAMANVAYGVGAGVLGLVAFLL